MVGVLRKFLTCENTKRDIAQKKMKTTYQTFQRQNKLDYILSSMSTVFEFGIK